MSLKKKVFALLLLTGILCCGAAAKAGIVKPKPQNEITQCIENCVTEEGTCINAAIAYCVAHPSQGCEQSRVAACESEEDSCSLGCGL